MRHSAVVFLLLARGCFFLPACAILAPVRLDHYEMAMKPAELEEKLAKKFPVKKAMLGGIMTLTLSEPHVELREGADRVSLFCRTVIEGGGPAADQPLEGVCRIESNVDYHAETRSIRLIDPVIRSFEIDGLPGNFAGMASFVAGVIAGDSLSAYPLHTFESENEPRAFGVFKLKQVRVEKGVLVMSLGL